MIKNISEIENKEYNSIKKKPIKERMDIFVPDIPSYMSNRNGMVYILTGSGGSGKSSLLLNFFKTKEIYRCKFDNIYYFCPESSFSSIEKHPFEKNDKIYHELTTLNLLDIYEELDNIKQTSKHPEYSLIIIDDFADSLKQNDIVETLNKFVIKARHLCVGFIFCLQIYNYLPKIIRKQLTYATIFKPKSLSEWYSVSEELMNLKKDDALKIYNYVYNEPYAHLDVDLINNIYYKNFNKLEFKD